MAKRFACDECGAGFKTRKELLDHKCAAAEPDPSQVKTVEGSATLTGSVSLGPDTPEPPPKKPAAEFRGVISFGAVPDRVRRLSPGSFVRLHVLGRVTAGGIAIESADLV